MAHDFRKWMQLFESSKPDFYDAETPEDVRRILEQLDAREVKFHHGPSVYVVGNHVVEWDGQDVYPDVEDAYQWVVDADKSVYFPDYEQEWNDRFWAYPSTLYHATAAKKAARIEKTGLDPQNLTRGISNRRVGAAVFTTSEFEDTVTGSYGEIVFAIDTKSLANDEGRPFAGREPHIEDCDLQQALAHMIGLGDFEPNYESDMSPNTVILYGPVPPQYLSRED